MIPLPAIERVLAEVARGCASAGVVPVENSTEGSVSLVLDLLCGEPGLAICGEVVLPVRQCLLARPGVQLSDIRRVFSHPQALAQCREYLRKRLPEAEWKECPSTSAAAVVVSGSDEPWAALGSARSAAANGLLVLAAGINDCPGNATRFWVVRRQPETFPAGLPCKTSICFSVHDRPGALCMVLREFAEREINLTRIESRPAKKKLGDYLFYLDISGGLQDPGIAGALAGLESRVLDLRVLGCYPVLGGV